MLDLALGFLRESGYSRENVSAALRFVAGRIIRIKRAYDDAEVGAVLDAINRSGVTVRRDCAMILLLRRSHCASSASSSLRYSI